MRERKHTISLVTAINHNTLDVRKRMPGNSKLPAYSVKPNNGFIIMIEEVRPMHWLQIHSLLLDAAGFLVFKVQI